MNATSKRIQLNKYLFAELISEVNGLCPLCSAQLITNGRTIGQAAHIYPHSPSSTEVATLKDIPKLSSNAESPENLIMLCPNCHWKIDHPRTRDGYMQLYNLKRQIIKVKKAKCHYESASLESDIIEVLESINNVNIQFDNRKLSYSAMTVEEKMSKGASNGIKNLVIAAVRDYFIPIHEALVQLEKDSPGKSTIIATEIALLYAKLYSDGLSQDEIYYAINDWLDFKTNHKYKYATPLITAFYIQDCEVFSI